MFFISIRTLCSVHIPTIQHVHSILHPYLQHPSFTVATLNNSLSSWLTRKSSALPGKSGTGTHNSAQTLMVTLLELHWRMEWRRRSLWLFTHTRGFHSVQTRLNMRMNYFYYSYYFYFTHFSFFIKLYIY